MVALRVLSALLIALSVAFAPMASAAMPAPAQMTMSGDGDHDCCPDAAQPCDMSKAGCLSMAACAAPPVFAAAAVQHFEMPQRAAALLVLPFSEIIPSLIGGPPLRPPQA